MQRTTLCDHLSSLRREWRLAPICLRLRSASFAKAKEVGPQPHSLAALKTPVAPGYVGAIVNVFAVGLICHRYTRPHLPRKRTQAGRLMLNALFLR